MTMGEARPVMDYVCPNLPRAVRAGVLNLDVEVGGERGKDSRRVTAAGDGWRRRNLIRR